MGSSYQILETYPTPVHKFRASGTYTLALDVPVSTTELVADGTRKVVRYSESCEGVSFLP